MTNFCIVRLVLKYEITTLNKVKISIDKKTNVEKTKNSHTKKFDDPFNNILNSIALTYSYRTLYIRCHAIPTDSIPLCILLYSPQTCNRALLRSRSTCSALPIFQLPPTIVVRHGRHKRPYDEMVPARDYNHGAFSWLPFDYVASSKGNWKGHISN